MDVGVGRVRVGGGYHWDGVAVSIDVGGCGDGGEGYGY